jgi:glycosyltransferase involved in cell wall biosynthesis
MVSANASSNSLVRLYPIAKVLARRHEVQVMGFRFDEEIFAPYSNEFDYDTLLAKKHPAFWSQVKAVAKRIRADAVYAFKPLPSSLWVGLAASRMHNIPLYLDVEDWEAGWYYDVGLSHRLRHLLHVERPNGLLWTWLTERMARRADEVFVVSRFLQRRFGGHILPHGADTAVFDPALWSKEEARRRIGLGDGRYIVFTGAPMPNKGLDDLLSAASLLGEPRLRVLVVGSFQHDPSYRERLLERYGDRLIIVGARPHSEMPLYLAAADLVALPQRPCRETVAQVPGKVFEAMAMARPIIATAVGDLPEILDRCGLIVPPRSIEALAGALERLLNDEEEATALGEQARLRCHKRYSWDAMEQILESRLGRESRYGSLALLGAAGQG